MSKALFAMVLGCSATTAMADCGWTKGCGPKGCHDCKNDGSAGFKQCCGGGGGGGGGRPSPRPHPGHNPRPGPRPGPTPHGPSGNAGTTRYWDCSGGACGGEWAAHCPNPNCKFPWGKPVCMPHKAAPRAIHHHSGATVFATAAASTNIFAGKGACGKCFLLTSPHGGKMIVKVNNECPGNSNPSCKTNHFDIAVPGFDWGPASVSNVCQATPHNCDPGVNSGICAKGSIASCDCKKVSSSAELQHGCEIFKALKWGDNPDVKMEPVGCPGAEHFVDMINDTSVVV